MEVCLTFNLGFDLHVQIWLFCNVLDVHKMTSSRPPYLTLEQRQKSTSSGVTFYTPHRRYLDLQMWCQDNVFFTPGRVFFLRTPLPGTPPSVCVCVGGGGVPGRGVRRKKTLSWHKKHVVLTLHLEVQITSVGELHIWRKYQQCPITRLEQGSEASYWLVPITFQSIQFWSK